MIAKSGTNLGKISKFLQAARLRDLLTGVAGGKLQVLLLVASSLRSFQFLSSLMSCVHKITFGFFYKDEVFIIECCVSGSWGWKKR